MGLGIGARWGPAPREELRGAGDDVHSAHQSLRGQGLRPGLPAAWQAPLHPGHAIRKVRLWGCDAEQCVLEALFAQCIAHSSENGQAKDQHFAKAEHNLHNIGGILCEQEINTC